MGQGMMVVAALLALGLLTLFFSDVEKKRYNPNQNPVGLVQNDVRQVVLERNRMGHYIVTGRINGTAVDFLLDTGATDVVLGSRLAKELGLQPGREGRARTANGMVVTHDTRINELSIGNIQLNNVPASITRGIEGDEILLGMSALKQVEFIQRGDTLTLRQVTYD